MQLRNRIAALLVGAVAASTLAATALPATAATAPNGLIAYAAWDAEGTGHDVFLMDPAAPSAAPARLTTDGRYNDNPDWNSDGTRIAYDGYGTFGSPRIWTMDADPSTNDSTPLTTPACTDGGCFWDFQPAWSPNDQRVAFASNRSPGGWGHGGYELFVVNATGESAASPAIQLTDTPRADQYDRPAIDWSASWSPDGSRLVFASSRGEGKDWDSCDLYVMDSVDANGDRQGDNLRRITFDAANAPYETVDCGLLQPAWSPVPGSSLVTFASTRDGYFDIHVVDVDNPSDIRNVTQSPEEYDDTPSWAPDGTQIVYRSSRSGAYELWSLPVPPAQTAAPAARSGGAQSVEEGTAASAAPTPTRLTTNGGGENSPKDEQAADWGARSGGGGGGGTTNQTLTVTRTGTGAGRVTSNPAGIACGTDCTQAYATGTDVTLSATAGSGSTFAGWSGACTGTGSCVVDMTAAKTVTATFNKTTTGGGTGGSYALTVTKQGRGRVTSSPAGITCGTDCTETYAGGTVVTLTAAANRGYKLSAWSGACTGSATTCTVTMSAAKSVKATFVRA